MVASELGLLSLFSKWFFKKFWEYLFFTTDKPGLTLIQSSCFVTFSLFSGAPSPESNFSPTGLWWYPTACYSNSRHRRSEGQSGWNTLPWYLQTTKAVHSCSRYRVHYLLLDHEVEFHITACPCRFKLISFPKGWDASHRLNFSPWLWYGMTVVLLWLLLWVVLQRKRL